MIPYGVVGIGVVSTHSVVVVVGSSLEKDGYSRNFKIPYVVVRPARHASE